MTLQCLIASGLKEGAPLAYDVAGYVGLLFNLFGYDPLYSGYVPPVRNQLEGII